MHALPTRGGLREPVARPHHRPASMSRPQCSIKAPTAACLCHPAVLQGVLLYGAHGHVPEGEDVLASILSNPSVLELQVSSTAKQQGPGVAVVQAAIIHHHHQPPMHQLFLTL